MATIKIVLRQKFNKDGTQPLCLRITKNRKTSFIHLGYSVNESDWDEKSQRVKRSFPTSTRMNVFLLKKLSEATENALELETKKTHVSAKAVRQKIKPTTATSFFSQAQSFLDDLKKAGKYNQYTSDKPRIGHFKQFLKGEDIAFSDISVGLLDKFVVYLKSSHKPKRGKDKISDRTIANHLVTIRSVFAYSRKNLVIDDKISPFGKSGVKIKFPDTKKVGISPEDVMRLETVILEDPRHDHARNLWLFSFYFAGMRISDVLRLKWSDFPNGRLNYNMGKNDKGGSLKIPDKAVTILDKYRAFKENADDFVFPELKDADLSDDFFAQRTIAFKVSAIDKVLRKDVAPAAGIDKHLTMHIARHTFGSIAGDAIPIQMLQKLYRHSNVTTTINYQQNFIHQDADAALDAVINKPIKQPKAD